MAEAARRKDERERIERAGACHADLSKWLQGVREKSQALRLTVSQDWEERWPRSAMSRDSVKLQFPLSLTWTGGTPNRSLSVDVDEKGGWVRWRLLDSRNRQVDKGDVDPRDFQGLQAPILRLATDSEWTTKA
jgi:hypothetical protein